MLKILQARHQQYVNGELPDVQAGFRKGRGTEIKLSTSAGSRKKQENSKEGQWKKMFQLVHNYTHLTCQQNHAENSPS